MNPVAFTLAAFGQGLANSLDNKEALISDKNPQCVQTSQTSILPP